MMNIIIIERSPTTETNRATERFKCVNILFKKDYSSTHLRVFKNLLYKHFQFTTFII